MAMQLNKVLSNGVSGNYWKVTDIQIHRLTSVIQVTVSLWLNESSKTSNLASISSKSYSIRGSDFTTVMGNSTNLLTGIYDYLKTLPDFSGEVDIL